MTTVSVIVHLEIVLILRSQLLAKPASEELNKIARIRLVASVPVITELGPKILRSIVRICYATDTFYALNTVL